MTNHKPKAPVDSRLSCTTITVHCMRLAVLLVDYSCKQCWATQGHTPDNTAVLQNAYHVHTVRNAPLHHTSSYVIRINNDSWTQWTITEINIREVQARNSNPTQTTLGEDTPDEYNLQTKYEVFSVNIWRPCLLPLQRSAT